MRYSERIKKPISYLKDNTAEVVSEITRSREPMFFTQNGETTFVVRDIKSWEEDEETLALLKILALGRQQIEQGKFTSAASVLAELENEVRSTAGAPLRRPV
ncbi:MAG: type II toxin-antitoxin system Phd/YefM family antitoxin [Pseudomonadota bacterium]